jgi:hypothetical protein
VRAKLKPFRNPVNTKVVSDSSSTSGAVSLWTMWARCGGDGQALAANHSHPNRDDQRLPTSCRATKTGRREYADLPRSYRSTGEDVILAIRLADLDIHQKDGQSLPKRERVLLPGSHPRERESDQRGQHYCAQCQVDS